MTHTLKIKEMFADRIVDGVKNFEVRLNDRDFQIGDLIQFHTVTNYNERLHLYHTINDRRYEIIYIHTGYGLQDGFVILGIRRYND